MNPHTINQRLARKGAIGELWAELQAEEQRAEEQHRKIDWRKILTTKLMREDVAQEKGK